MRYIDKWLSGLGLDYIIPKLEANGITTPKKLAQLTLRDMFEVVGVEDPEDRKKLYFLIQRLQSILNKSENEEEATKETETSSAKVARTRPVTPSRIPAPAQRQTADDDLRSLRRQHKIEDDVAPAVLLSQNDEDISIGRGRSSSNPQAAVETVKIESSVPSKEDNRKSTRMTQPLPTSARPPIAPGREEAVQGTAINNNRLSMQLKRPTPTSAQSSSLKIEAQSKSGAGTPRSPNLSRKPSPKRTTLAASPTRLDSPRRHGSGIASEGASDIRAPSQVSVSTVSGTKSTPPMNYQWHGADKLIDDMDTLTESPRTSPQHLSLQDLAIRVVVRKRPLSRSELVKGERDVLEILPNGRVSVHEPKLKVDLTRFVETQAFMFDDAFDCDDHNDVIYSRTVKPLVMNVFNGGKATCFAYGQTGSGKTFTMMGETGTHDPKKLGLYVHAARDIFGILQKAEYSSYQAYVSCFEIYGGKLFDLLHDRGLVKCLEDSKQQVQILGLTEHRVTTVELLMELMHVAHNVRSTGATGANSESSRSHLIMQIEIKKVPAATSTSNRRVTNSFQRQFKDQPVKLVVVGKLSFIDLAGSERGKDTTDNSKQTRMEGAEINTSLLALKEVIRSLNRQHAHTPFRGSKLTQVLKDSFIGENTKTCMVACVSPSHLNCEHTLNTLRYADRVKEHQVASTGNVATGNDYELTSSPPNDVPMNEPIDDYSHSQPVPPPPIPTISRANSSSKVTTGQVKSTSPQIRLSPSLPNEDNVPDNVSGSARIRERKAISKRPSAESSNSTPPTRSGTHTPPPPPEPVHDTNPDFNNTLNIQMTVSLLTTHKISIADMVEVMKEEMQLVQDMEHADDRDSEGYVDKLEQILELKLEGITSLRKELHSFQKYRNNQRGIQSEDFKSADNISEDISVYSEDNDLLSIPGVRSIQRAVVKQQLSDLPSDRKVSSFNGNNKRISTGNRR